MNDKIKNLIDKYVALGDDRTAAWFWANNPSNPESPKYDVKQAAKCDKIKNELIS